MDVRKTGETLRIGLYVLNAEMPNLFEVTVRGRTPTVRDALVAVRAKLLEDCSDDPSHPWYNLCVGTRLFQRVEADSSSDGPGNYRELTNPHSLHSPLSAVGIAGDDAALYVTGCLSGADVARHHSLMTEEALAMMYELRRVVVLMATAQGVACGPMLGADVVSTANPRHDHVHVCEAASIVEANQRVAIEREAAAPALHTALQLASCEVVHEAAGRLAVARAEAGLRMQLLEAHTRGAVEDEEGAAFKKEILAAHRKALPALLLAKASQRLECRPHDINTPSSTDRLRVAAAAFTDGTGAQRAVAAVEKVARDYAFASFNIPSTAPIANGDIGAFVFSVIEQHPTESHYAELAFAPVGSSPGRPGGSAARANDNRCYWNAPHAVRFVFHSRPDLDHTLHSNDGSGKEAAKSKCLAAPTLNQLSKRRLYALVLDLRRSVGDAANGRLRVYWSDDGTLASMVRRNDNGEGMPALRGAAPYRVCGEIAHPHHVLGIHGVLTGDAVPDMLRR